MIKITERKFGKKFRAAVISDVHGSFALFQRLLRREEVQSADWIVFDGDYISRGRESLKILRALAELSKQDNVIILKGNLERLVNWYINGEPEGILRHFRGHKYNLFRECIEEQNAGEINADTFPKLRRLFAEKYPDIISYCADLPNALETEDFVFTHAGLGTQENWRDSTEQEVMKNDPFIRVGVNTTGKWLVCGHMPTWNVEGSENTNNCFVDYGRKCVFIDGGNQVKNDDQLNALIIDGDNGEYRFSTIFESWFPVFFASHSWSSDLDYGCEKDRWPEFSLTVIEPGEDFSLCRRSTGEACYVNSAHLIYNGENAEFYRNTVSSLLSVKAGEKLELLDAPKGKYVFVRKTDGRIGWVPRSVMV